MYQRVYITSGWQHASFGDMLVIDTFLSILYWFARPSIAAWAGAVATVVAVFLAEPRRHLRHPMRLIGRIPRIIIVWLIIAWMLSQLAGRGTGGAGRGGGHGDTIGPWVHNNTSDGNEASTVRIRFIPQPGKKELASDFICIVRIETTGGETQERKLVGDTLLDFEQQLERALKGMPERPGRVIVEKQPNPGNGVLRIIHTLVQKIWPNLAYEEVEP